MVSDFMPTYQNLKYIVVFHPLSLFFLIIYVYIYLFIYLFLLYNIVLVLPYINMHPPWVYTCSHPLSYLTLTVALEGSLD